MAWMNQSHHPEEQDQVLPPHHQPEVVLERLAPLRMKRRLLLPKDAGLTVPQEVILNRSHRHLNQGELVKKGPCFQVRHSLDLELLQVKLI